MDSGQSILFSNLAAITATIVSPIVAMIIAIIVLRRRTPPLSEELYKDFATKAEVTALRTHFDVTMKEYFERQHLDGKSVEDKFQAIMRSVGRIEGQLERCPLFCPPPGDRTPKTGG